jgi:hypothetical protein
MSKNRLPHERITCELVLYEITLAGHYTVYVSTLLLATRRSKIKMNLEHNVMFSW